MKDHSLKKSLRRLPSLRPRPPTFHDTRFSTAYTVTRLNPQTLAIDATESPAPHERLAAEVDVAGQESLVDFRFVALLQEAGVVILCRLAFDITSDCVVLANDASGVGPGPYATGSLKTPTIRVYRTGGSITPAFEEFCRIKEAVEDYPILDEEDYSARKFAATLENYRGEMWRLEGQLPEGWESEVYAWFSDHGHDCYTENTDDQGGWASKEKIVEALQALGYVQADADTPIVVVQGAGENLPQSL